MAKPIAVVLPALFLCLDVWPLRRLATASNPDGVPLRRLISEKMPLFAMAAGVAVLTVWSQASLGAMSSLESVPAGARVANAVASLSWYLQKAVWPSNLAAIYPLRVPVPWQEVAIGAVVLVALLTAIWTQRHTRPWVSAGCAWFLIALVPVCGLFQTGAHAYADRNMYLPLIGLAIAAAGIVGNRLGTKSPRNHSRAVASATALLAVVAVSGAAWQASLQTRHWRDSESLFRQALAVTDNNYIAATALATTLRRKGEVDEPARLYRDALRAAPRYAAARAGLGETLLAQGAADAAVYELSRAVEIDPSVAEYWVNLGSALHASGRPGGSVWAFRRAEAIAPERADVHSGMAAALAESGDIASAVKELETAINLNPAYADAHLNLGLVQMRAGNTGVALAALENARRLAPLSLPAWIASGHVLMQLGRFQEAVDVLAQAVTLAPADALLRSNFGGALLAAGRLSEAEAALQEAARLAPDLEAIRENLKALKRPPSTHPRPPSLSASLNRGRQSPQR